MWMRLDSFPSHGDSETHALGLTGTLGQQWKGKRVGEKSGPLESCHFGRKARMDLGR